MTSLYTLGVNDIQIIGQGQPIVVLLSGLGVPALLWHELGDWAEDILPLIHRDAWDDQPFLAPSLAKDFTVVTYDRQGIVSDPPAQPRQINDFLDELDAVLEQRQLTAPLILIGHSLGGLIALEYTRRHRERVAALVLLDSSHPNQLPHFAQGANAQQSEFEGEERQQMATHHSERPDLERLLSQGEDVVRTDQFDGLPLLVVTRGIKPWPGEGGPESPMTPAYWQHREQTWQHLQRALTATSRAGKQLCLPDSGHYVHLDEPLRVIGAIQDFLNTLRIVTPDLR